MTLFTLQRILWPDMTIPPECFGRGLATGGGPVTLAHGGSLHLGGYMNCFDAGLWHRCTPIRHIAIRISGQGNFRVQCRLHDQGGATDLRHFDTVAGRANWLPLPPSGQISLTIDTVTGGTIDDVVWLCDLHPKSHRTVVCVTNFERDRAVIEAMHTITAAGIIGMVIDNSGRIEGDYPFAVISNPNLGGAGGFARAITECRARGLTHAIFMDDDARAPIESVQRMIRFLGYATAPDTAVTGAMVSDMRPNEIWENGATFYKRCRPRNHRQNLTNFEGTYRMLARQDASKPDNFYGGWWLFGFPIAHVDTLPFPYFVRGDDIGFSIANSFRHETMAGVFAIQPDFVAKESAFSLYLDLRNHLHQHMVHSGIALGRLRCAGIALSFIGKSVFRLHYASAEAQILAWRDVMRHPRFWADPQNTLRRKQQISGLARAEVFQPSQTPPPRPKNRRLYRVLAVLTLNGLLLPGFRSFGRDVVVPTHDRAALWPFALARRATVLSGDGTQGYTLHHSKMRAVKIAATLGWILTLWLIKFTAIKRAQLAAYRRMTTPAFWADQFTKYSRTHPIDAQDHQSR